MYSDDQIRKLRKFLNSKEGNEISEEDRKSIFEEIAKREMSLYTRKQEYIKKKIRDIV